MKSYEKLLKVLLQASKETNNRKVFSSASFSFDITDDDLMFLDDLKVITLKPYVTDDHYRITLLPAAYTYFQKKRINRNELILKWSTFIAAAVSAIAAIISLLT